MKYTKRQPQILEMLRQRGSCGISELAGELGVSLETIRRDLRPLAESGELIKIHGSVMLPNYGREARFRKRMEENVDAKLVIARAVAGIIESGSTVMIETGSTANFIARQLVARDDLTIVTNSVEIARIVASSNRHRLFLSGGEVRLDDGAALGSAAVDYVRRFNVDYGIISAGAISVAAGLTNYDPLDSEFCRALLAQASVRIAALDRSKFGRETLVHVCHLDGIDILATDHDPGDAFREALASAGVRLAVAQSV